MCNEGDATAWMASINLLNLSLDAFDYLFAEVRDGNKKSDKVESLVIRQFDCKTMPFQGSANIIVPACKIADAMQ